MCNKVDVHAMILGEDDKFYSINVNGAQFDVLKKMVFDVDYNTELDVVMTLSYGYAAWKGIV